MSWLKSLLRMGSRARLVGSDLHGNKYFEELGSRGRRPKRSVEMAGARKEEEYSQESIPPEWDRWLRWLRNDPPTLQELTAREKQLDLLQHRVAEVQRKDAERQAKEIAEGLVSSKVKATEHASAPSFKSQDKMSEEPTSTGKDFQPASWKPGQQ